MKQTPVLLNTPDKRDVHEALIWYKDGWQLIRKQMGAWASYMAIGLCFVFAVLLLINFLVASVIEALPGLTYVGALIIAVFSSWAALALQSGMYCSMAGIINGNKIDNNDLFWIFSQLKNQQFWFFIVVVSLSNLVFQWLRSQWIGDIVYLDSTGKLIFNQEQMEKFMLLSTVYWSIISVLTWAVLPIMTEFSAESFVRSFKRNFTGTVRNIKPLLYLTLLIVFTLLTLMVMISFIGSIIHSFIFLVFVLLFTLWGVPLINAWIFSAYRHIFTNW